LKGIVFNLLEDVVSAEFGPQAWEDLLAEIGSGGVYTSLGSYPDEQMQAMVMAAAKKLDKSRAEVLRWFGRAAMPRLIERYPHFFEHPRTARELVLSVNQIIHPEVRKIYPGAVVPTFDFRDAEDGSLLMGYRSPRKLCALAQGFVEGAAAHYGETIQFAHLKCMHRGDDECLMRISFGS
jgi:predicted hydrocarbon binding protein